MSQVYYYRFNGFRPSRVFVNELSKTVETVQRSTKAQAFTRLKPGENEKKSARCFWMNPSRKEREGGQSPPSRQYRTFCK